MSQVKRISCNDHLPPSVNLVPGCVINSKMSIMRTVVTGAKRVIFEKGLPLCELPAE